MKLHKCVCVFFIMDEFLYDLAMVKLFLIMMKNLDIIKRLVYLTAWKIYLLWLKKSV